MRMHQKMAYFMEINNILLNPVNMLHSANVHTIPPRGWFEGACQTEDLCGKGGSQIRCYAKLTTPLTGTLSRFS